MKSENTEKSYLHISKDVDSLDSEIKLGQDDFIWKK